MEKQEFQLLISYPDGHVEEIQETFYTLESAKEYASNMMNQIKATESFHANKEGILGGSKRHKAHFRIIETHSKEIVFEGK